MERKVIQVDDEARSLGSQMSDQLRHMHQIQRAADAVADSTQDMAKECSELQVHASTASRSISNTSDHCNALQGDLSGLKDRLKAVIRNSGLAERRRFERIPVDLTGSIRSQTQGPMACRIQDLSFGGAKIVDAGVHWENDTRFVLDFAPVGEMRCRLVRSQGDVLHVEFDPAPVAGSALDEFLRTTQAADQKLVVEITRRAAEIGVVFENAVKKGTIRVEDLFSTDYQPVPETNPEQYHTPFVDFTDRVLPPLQEPMLEFDERVVFCAAVDRNAFLPTHNRHCSKPQGSDPVWNAAHSRNRRFFKDRTGSQAASHTLSLIHI